MSLSTETARLLNEYDGTAVRKPAPRPKVTPKPKQETHKAPQVYVNGYIVWFALFILFCAGTMVLLSLDARNNELQSQIQQTREQIDILEAEKVRLNSEMNALYTPDKIEEWAEEHGMVKVDASQITYIDLSEGDKVVLSGGKTPRR